MLGAVAATATTSSASSNLTVGVTTNRLWYNYQKKIEPEPSFPGASDVWFVARINQSPLLKIDDEYSDFEQFDGIHYYMQKLTPDEIPQEWRDTWQQSFKQQMSVAQELLKIQETQQPKIPQF
jgi:hypothetical protein